MQDKREDIKQKQPIDVSSQHGHEASYPEEVIIQKEFDFSYQ